MENTIVYENEKVMIKSCYRLEKRCYDLILKSNNKVIETFSAVYPETIHNNKLIVRSIIPPFSSAIVDLDVVGTDKRIYAVPFSYFKIIFFEKVGYLLVLSPNDCELVDFTFKLIPPGRCEKITITDNVIIGRKNDEEIRVPIVPN